MMEHIQGQTFHARRGALKNAFRYGVDFVLWDPQKGHMPGLISRNRFNLWSIRDANHGGPRGAGHGIDWFRDVLAQRGFELRGARLLLLTQPSFLWFHFNPVSFWIALREGAPCAIIAEVNNTFGHRHCYFCAHPDFRHIRWEDKLTADKLMHVSPFQKIAGSYRFNFDISEQEICIRIDYRHGNEGVLATLSGRRQPATSASLLHAALRRPLGAARVLTLIHWQAVKLIFKRAPFLDRQAAPATLLSESHEFQEPST